MIEDLSESMFKIDKFCLLFFQLRYERLLFTCTDIPPHLHAVLATAGHLSYRRTSFLLLVGRSLCPSCHSCYQKVTFFQFFVSEMLLQLWHQTITNQETNSRAVVIAAISGS